MKVSKKFEFLRNIRRNTFYKNYEANSEQIRPSVTPVEKYYTPLVRLDVGDENIMRFLFQARRILILINLVSIESL